MKTFKEFISEDHVNEGLGSLLVRGARAVAPYVKPIARRVGSTVDDAPVLMSNAAQTIRKTSGDAITAIRKYTDNSTSLNATLTNRARGAGLQSITQRIMKPSWFPKPREVLSRTRNLDKSIKGEKLDADTAIYHGTDVNPLKMGTTKGNQVTIPSYLSTTKDPKIADVAARSKAGPFRPKHVLQIKAKAGQTGKDIEHISTYPGEREVLLPRNTELRVSSTPTYGPRTLKQPRRTRYWDAEIVSQGKRVPASSTPVSPTRVARDVASKSQSLVPFAAGATAAGATAKAVHNYDQSREQQQAAWAKEYRAASPERKRQMDDALYKRITGR